MRITWESEEDCTIRDDRGEWLAEGHLGYFGWTWRLGRFVPVVKSVPVDDMLIRLQAEYEGAGR